MPQNVHFVFSVPPSDVSEAEFSNWYETHVDEILDVPGFASARRYWLDQAVATRAPIVYRHLSIYVLEEGVGSREPLAQLGKRMQDGQLTVPEWFGSIRFASYDGYPLEAEELALPDHLYLVLSRPPAAFDVDGYYDWYAGHMRENLTADGFDAGWRFRLAGATIDPLSTTRHVHAALYEVHMGLADLRAALDEAARAGRVDIPAWMRDGEFTSMDCAAISALALSDPVS